jgi:uncharacterized integral membrane protein
MRAGGCNFERALGRRLAFDIAKIRRRGQGSARARLCTQKRCLAGEMRANLVFFYLEPGDSMRALVWSLRILVFLFLFAFAVKNTDTVTINYFFGGSTSTPMIVVILAAFGLGIFAGVLAMVGPLFRSRRQLSRLRKVKSAEHPPHSLPVNPDA